VAKLNGRITQHRQESLGVERYEWSSSGDERVRKAHRKLDGQVRRWDDPHPTEGHPGSAIACRCVAIAVFDEEDEG
jgi:SPP1 gp7 family putative phage head morphogenesis protein